MSDLLGSLQGRTTGSADDRLFCPQRFNPQVGTDRAALIALLGSDQHLLVHDTLLAQLGELCETRTPTRKLSQGETAAQCEQTLGAISAEDYGCWFFYPWSHRLVHVLPEAEYRELRSSRNRNKISVEEQARLGHLRVGVVGLSVGQATALTLGLEGIGHHFRLADFDTLSLSNMNRLRASAHEIGLNKAVLTARELYEIDPYLDVKLYPDGIGDHNIDDFLTGGGPLHLLFEECDDLQMKVRLREQARAHRIAVLMETSDRGLFDVERFDREPERPLFHGLAGELDSAALGKLSTQEKVPTVLKIIGAERVSLRMAASMVDIDTTLKTWPQLASAVALGGAINTDAARRIALSSFTESGRYYVDIGELVADRTATQIAPSSEPSPQPTPWLAPPALHGLGPRLTQKEITALSHYGVLAPSGGNCQPWRFEYRSGVLRCFHEIERSRSMLDFEHRASYLAFGCAAENIAQAARQIGFAAEFDRYPEPSDPTCVWQARFSKATASSHDAARLIAARATNRRLGPRVAIDAQALAQLTQLGEAAGAQLDFLVDPPRLDEIGAILGEGDRARFLSHTLHQEMMRELRWNRPQAEATRDGLDLPTLELSSADIAGLKLAAQWPVMAELGKLDAGQGLTKPSQKSIAAAGGVGLLTISSTDPRDYLEAGRCLEQIWLQATELGLSMQPMTALVYLFCRLRQGAVDADLGRHLTPLHDRYTNLFDLKPGRSEAMLFRIGTFGPPSARSLRRSLQNTLFLY